ncbi:MAG TPA: OmpH family outer membrane protein [Candidatus Binatia bacterium]|nr:OmpH family outer membrane protein [Candidatus Binatia bacterium]
MKPVHLIGAALLLALLSVPVAVQAAEPKIGVVDLQRALNESDAGKKAKVDFKARVDKLEGQLKGQKEELDRLKEELERKAVVMRDDERRKLSTDFEKKRLDLKSKFEEAQGELQRKDQELTGQIIEGLTQVIKQIAENENYTLVLETSSSGVLYHANSIDLTEQVLSTYNARH